MSDGDVLPVRPEQAERFEKELLDMPLPEEDAPVIALADPAFSEAAVRAYFETGGKPGARRRIAEDVLLDYFR